MNYPYVLALLTEINKNIDEISDAYFRILTDEEFFMLCSLLNDNQVALNKVQERFHTVKVEKALQEILEE